MLLAVSGLAGTGKDSVADVLVRGAFVRVALADPLKRIARDVYDFSDEQLWGPSQKRNEPDKRYPRQHSFQHLSGSWTDSVHQCSCCGQKCGSRLSETGDSTILRVDEVDPCYLTARYALQTLGTEWGRNCFPDTWVNYGIRVHDRLQKGDCYYDQKTGLRTTSKFEGETWVQPKKDVVISDIRFKNELRLVREAGGKVVRVVRPGVTVPEWAHPSEMEQMTIPDSEFDYIVVNDGTLNDLAGKVQTMLEKLSP